MTISFVHFWDALAMALLFGFASAAGAAEIGQIKVAKGQVAIERQGKAVPAIVGTRPLPKSRPESSSRIMEGST